MEFIKKYLSEAIAFVLGFVLAFAFLSFNANSKKEKELEKEIEKAKLELNVEETKKAEEKTISMLQKSQESILAKDAKQDSLDDVYSVLKVSDQKAGKEVDVAYVKTDIPVWLVVHMEKDGKIMNALGARLKQKGEWTGVVVPLLAPTKKGGKYWLVLYADNGDGKFDLKTDYPLKLKDTNNYVMLPFEAM